MQFDELSSFVNLDTGGVETVSNDLLRKAEESEEGDAVHPDLPDWQMEEWKLARRIASSDRFQKLPEPFDIDEWSIMQQFAFSVEADRVRQELLNVIQGRGAFRRFKDAIRRHGIEDSWFRFRTEALTRIVIEVRREQYCLRIAGV